MSCRRVEAENRSLPQMSGRMRWRSDGPNHCWRTKKPKIRFFNALDDKWMVKLSEDGLWDSVVTEGEAIKHLNRLQCKKCIQYLANHSFICRFGYESEVNINNKLIAFIQKKHFFIAFVNQIVFFVIKIHVF